MRGQVPPAGSSYCYRATAPGLTRGSATALGIPRGPQGPLAREQQRKAQQEQHPPHADLTGHLLLPWQLPLCRLPPAGIWLMDAESWQGLAAGGRMGRKRLCEPSWRALGRNLALPTPTPRSFSLGKVQPSVYGVNSTLQPCLQPQGSKHLPLRPLPEEQSSPP